MTPTAHAARRRRCGRLTARCELGTPELAELRAWAWRLLTGTSLADKLTARGTGWVPDGALPTSPGRPTGLELRPAGSQARAAFPAERELASPEGRGRALHFFANHELMALELMALTLLRFPEAPKAFQAGLAGVMADEQRHLQAYVARMEASGVRFGDLPVNRYFWDALAGAVDPLAMVAGLSLTFESANLDFAAGYAAAFRRVGDEETAAALDGVLADEVRHVRHGLGWLDRWRPAGSTRWQAWLDVLPAPLTPARARGPVLAREARIAAGFDEDQLAQLASWAAAGGRPPVVWSFHPGVEADIAGRTASAVEDVEGDLAGLMQLLASRGDVVLVPRRPTEAHLRELEAVGVPRVELIEGGPEHLRGRSIGGVRPWGWSPRVCRQWTAAGARWDPRWRPLFEKTWSAELLAQWPDLCEPEVVGVCCRSVEEVARVATERHVLKAPLGTAGQGLRRWSAPGVEGWTRRVIAAQGAVVVEPWLDRVVDLSLQMEVGADGALRAWPWGRFLTDPRGRYRGAVLGRSIADLPSGLQAFIHAASPTLQEVARRLALELHARGFSGPAGIDALVWRRAEGGWGLKPLVELNPRLTMGRVAIEVEARMRRGRVGLWTQVSVEVARARGAADLATWASELRGRAPLRCSGSPPQIDSGAWFTTDPARASRLVTVLVVAPTLAEAQALLEG
jgi:uncharacterized ferritin-like protein (DUF455 family)